MPHNIEIKRPAVVVTITTYGCDIDLPSKTIMAEDISAWLLREGIQQLTCERTTGQQVGESTDHRLEYHAVLPAASD